MGDTTTSGPSSRPRDGGADDDASLFRTFRNWLRDIGWARGDAVTLRAVLEKAMAERTDLAAPLGADERTMLSNILEFGELTVGDVMVPRADIVAIEDDVTIDALVEEMVAAGHSRVPIFRESLDDVLGMVHIKDVLAFWGKEHPTHLKGIIRELIFVPPSMRVLDLLVQMRQTRVHMAIVVDEFGGTDGLATIEDLVEEIIGEIHDEHEQVEEPVLIARDDGGFDADARVRVEELEEQVGIDLLPDERDEDVETLGGLVVSLLGHVPAAGEVLRHASGLEFEVVEADARRIKRLTIRKTSPSTVNS